MELFITGDWEMTTNNSIIGFPFDLILCMYSNKLRLGNITFNPGNLTFILVYSIFSVELSEFPVIF